MKIGLIVRVTFFTILFFVNQAISQTRYEVQGRVYDQNTNIGLPATILLIGSKQFITSDNQGLFKFQTISGTIKISISHEGYNTLYPEITISGDSTLNFSLTSNLSLTEVNITSDKNGSNPGANSHVLTKKDIEKAPAFMGQRDPLRTIKTLPGIANAGEGNSGLYVRGGTAGQNLTLLDDATIYNPSHILGFFSVFNGDAVDNIKLYKSGIPVEFGGRLSSVVEVSSDKKIADSLSIRGDISILAGNLSITAPISEYWSVSASARKTYMGLTVWPVLNKLNLASKLFSKLNYDFSDLNLSSNAQLSKRDYLHFSAFSSGDAFGFGLKSASISNAMKWKNNAVSLGWNAYLKSDLHLITTASYSSYRFNLDMDQEKYEAGISSRIKDINLKSTLNYSRGKHSVKAGIQLINHHFKPNTPYSMLGETNLDFGLPNIYNALENSIFLSDEIKLRDKTTIYAGGRFTIYQHMGPFTDITSGGQEIIYSKKNTIASYQYIEPTLILKNKLSNSSSLKFSISRNVQPLHLVSVTAVNFPSDFWIPSLKNLAPEKGTHASAGYFLNPTNNIFEAYIDLYYKEMKGLIEYSGGIMNLLDNLKIEDRLLFGKGNSYGAEFYLKKKQGKATGWLSYTLAKSNRNFPLINNNKSFPAKYDRRHDLSLVSNYSISPRLTVSGYFNYATGNTYTKPVSRFLVAGNIINEYGSFNGSRMPAYHRLDLSATYKMKTKTNYKSELSLSVYNVYNRQNPVFLYFVAKGDLEKSKISIKPESIAILPVLPSLTYRFSF